ncbi:hypothetical protein KAI87_15815, partial [Myxococcota bacterium]|nr:hypothetical protein [Myxococcota bacterium]
MPKIENIPSTTLDTSSGAATDTPSEATDHNTTTALPAISGSATDQREVRPTSTVQVPTISASPLELASPKSLPKPEAKPSRSLSLTLANPWESSKANKDISLLVNRSLGYAISSFAEKYPMLDQNVALRTVEYAGTAVIEMQKFIYLHELAHAREVTVHGGDPEVDMYFGAGLTTFNMPDDFSDPDGKKFASIYGAGTSQVQLSARENYLQWAVNGDAYYQEAMAYLLESFHTASYALRSYQMRDDPSSGDDMHAYVRHMAKSGYETSVGRMAAIALAAELGNAASLFTAAKSQIDFLKDGNRHAGELPAFNIGSLEILAPHFAPYFTADGILGSATTVINPNSETPIAVDFMVELEDFSAFAAKGQLLGMPLSDDKSLRVSPFVGVSVYDSGEIGGVVGSDVTKDLGDNMSVSVQAAYKQSDLF